MKEIKEIIQENNKRNRSMREGFSPLTGEGSVIRSPTKLYISDFSIPEQIVPKEMIKNKLIKSILSHGSIKAFLLSQSLEYTDDNREKIERAIIKIRSRYDFCFWAFFFVKIKPKAGGEMIPFSLHYEQRILLAELEDMRLANKPIRIILLKARQWGGSTLVQIYIAWIQLLHKKGFYSTIVAQTKDVSRKIKAMYSKMLEYYPAWMLDLPDTNKLEFSPYEGSASDYVITTGPSRERARDSITTIGTYENPDATRGGDTSLIHYSEVAMWHETDGKKPEDVIRSITGGLLNQPLTVEVLESTANGTGNYFHREWVRAKSGESNRRAVFIPFYMIEHDSQPIDNIEEFAQWLYDNKDNRSSAQGTLDHGVYYWRLWKLGSTLESINWYIDKRKSFLSHADMASEAPADDIEAFKHSGNKIFSVYYIDKLRLKTKAPIILCDIYSSISNRSIKSLHLTTDNRGELKIWRDIDNERVTNRYIVIVDIGGRGNKSDYSVIVVIDRLPLLYGGAQEIAAQWRGHIDHDLLAWKSAQIASYYNNALLVIESNTLETKSTEGNHTNYILNQIADVYPNLYARQPSEDDLREGKPTRWGFHTNTSTKQLIIDNLITALRDQQWIERDDMCADELGAYERRPNGSYGAIPGHHDDILMTRAIGLYISISMPLPRYVENKQTIKNRSNYNESKIV